MNNPTQSSELSRTMPDEQNALPTREEAQKLLEEHVKDTYQLLHAKMVANAMDAWAKKLGNSEELWYITGLLHDIDYHEFPAEHPNKSLVWFKEWKYPESLITAVAEHAFMRTNVEVSTQMGSALIACDELSGLIYAYSKMRPDKLKGMEVAGVKKRLKDKAFAPKIDREDINFGVEKFGVSMDEHIALLIETFAKMPEFS